MNSHFRVFAGSLLIAVFYLALAAPGARGAMLLRQTSTPIEFTALGDHPVINIEINGIRGRFMLDTGSDEPVVTDAFVHRVGLGTRILNPAPTGSTAPSDQVTDFPYIIVGDFRLNERIEAFVVKSVGSRDDPDSIDGTFSWHILREFASLIDFGARRLTLWYPPNLAEIAVKDAGMAAAKPVPLILDQYRLLHTFIKIGAAEFWVRLDTGSELTTPGRARTGKLKLRPLAQGVWLDPEGNRIGVNIARCQAINVGSARFGPSLVQYDVLQDYEFKPVLGMSTLRNARILIDPGSLQMRFAATPRDLPANITDDWVTCHVPMRLVGEEQIPVIGVKLPDHKLHWFGLTFNGYGAIDRRLAESLGLPEQPIPGAPGSNRVNVDLDFAGHTLKNVGLLAEPSDVVDPDGEGFEGVIGSEMLRKIPVKIDLFRNRAEIILPGPSGLLPPPPSNETATGVAPIPVSSTFIPEAPYGSWTTYADLDLRLTTAGPSFDTREIIDLIGAERQWTQSTRRFALSSQRGHLPVGRFRALKMDDVTVPGPEIVGVNEYEPVWIMLGLDFFRGCSLYLDAPMQAIYITRSTRYRRSGSDLDEYEGTGIESLKHVGPDTYISSILSPSPASEAGLQLGNQILKIDGVAPAKIPPRTLAHKLWSPDGKTVSLTIQRKGQPRPIEARLVRRKLL